MDPTDGLSCMRLSKDPFAVGPHRAAHVHVSKVLSFRSWLNRCTESTTMVMQAFAASMSFERRNLLLKGGDSHETGWLLEKLDCMHTGDRRAWLDAVCLDQCCASAALSWPSHERAQAACACVYADSTGQLGGAREWARAQLPFASAALGALCLQMLLPGLQREYACRAYTQMVSN